MDFRRLRQVCRYGWKDAAIISQEDGVDKSRTGIFCDMLGCFLRYNVWTNQYKKEKLYLLRGEERKAVCLKYQEMNTRRDQWVKQFFQNYKFLNKWSSFKYERSASLQAKRRAAYKKQYGLGENCFIGYGVIFHRHHYVDAKIETGVNCGFSEHVNVDFTGGLTLGNRVWLSEGAKVLTHNHSIGMDNSNIDKGCILTPLIMQDDVWVGTQAIIMPGVREIGRGAVISAHTVVNSKIPPYAIVMGNPAKVIGFKKTPEEILEFELTHYEEKDRIPKEVIYGNYEKYFRSRWKELKQWSKI